MDESFEDMLWKWGVESAGLSAHSQALRGEARPSYWIEELKLDRYRETGNSRLGGEPDLPRGYDWPQVDDRHMTFLAQINLGSLQPGHVPGLPEQGWLYFFLGSERNEYDLPHRILYFNGPVSQLARTPPPRNTQPVEAARRFKPYQAPFRPVFTLSPESPVWEQIGVEEPPWWFVSEGCTQLGGHAVTLAGDPAENAYLARNGFGALVGMAVSSPVWLDHTEKRMQMNIEQAQAAGKSSRALSESLEALKSYRPDIERHQQGIAEWELLFILGTEDKPGMRWGDMGNLQFMIRTIDLHDCRFDNTYCEFYSS